MNARSSFAGGITPQALVQLVHAAVPFVVPRDDLELSDERGYLRGLAEAVRLTGSDTDPQARLAYFRACLAAHHVTVASFVPTDVDSKIRGLLWKRAAGPWLRARREALEQAWTWRVDEVSTRSELTAHGRISGHDGEWLGVSGGWLAAAVLANDADETARAAARIHDELTRQAAAYQAAETTHLQAPTDSALALRLLRLAWILTHNVGDVDQGISYWPEDARLVSFRVRFHELAHADPTRFSGVFLRAKNLYQLVSAEGHRNYPLREAKSLRRSAAFLLPLGPCLETWGSTIGSAPELTASDHAEIVSALCHGIVRVRGQIGYQRALHGFAASCGTLNAVTKRLPATARDVFDRTDVRQHLRQTPAQFASELTTRIHAIARL